MPVGLYISVPFCRTKCTYCNFASDVFSRAVFEKYVVRLCAEIERSRETARHMGGLFDPWVDSIYFGGGTPTLLDVTQLQRLFVTIRQNFQVHAHAEITIECAPGTLSQPVLHALLQFGVNRVSLGMQSFVDQEAAAVGRLHKRAVVLDDIARLRSAGIPNINVDLIAGLPHQTQKSWEESLNGLIATGVPHASIYMLEIDDDSRLGRELIAGGQKYHAHFVPDEDLIADLYELACDRLNATGIEQYEISNFARPGFESKHNLKYWTRRTYLGFGVDAHSMLPMESVEHHFDADDGREGHDFQSCRREAKTRANGTAEGRALPAVDVTIISAIRFSNPENLDEYLRGAPATRAVTSAEVALQEAFFLGLRMNRGVSLNVLTHHFDEASVTSYAENISELIEADLLAREDSTIRLTARGRLLSNEVFERFISVKPDPATTR